MYHKAICCFPSVSPARETTKKPFGHFQIFPVFLRKRRRRHLYQKQKPNQTKTKMQWLRYCREQTLEILKPARMRSERSSGGVTLKTCKEKTQSWWERLLGRGFREAVFCCFLAFVLCIVYVPAFSSNHSSVNPFRCSAIFPGLCHQKISWLLGTRIVLYPWSTSS